MFNFHPETIDAVKDVLNTLYKTQARCRIFYGDVKTAKVGSRFSKAFSNLRCTGVFTRMAVYQEYHSDIMSIWECEETGNKFAFYVNSGIRQITERLYQDQLNHFFHHGNVI